MGELQKKHIFLILIIGIIPAILISTNYSWLLDDDKKIVPNIQNIDLEKLSKSQIPFIENMGQKNEIIKFYAKTFAGTVFVTDSNLTYQSIIQKNDVSKSIVLKEIFVDGKINPSGKIPSETIINYYKGEQKNWITNAPSYNIVSLGSVWKNIDVSLQAYENNIEKIFTVYPGGNPNEIQLEFDGIKKLNTNEFGELEIQIDDNLAKFSTPVAFQQILGEIVPVNVKYSINENYYGFQVEEYRKDLPLVIDPLIASTFIGSDTDEDEGSIALDSSGNIFVVGLSFDSDYPSAPPDDNDVYQPNPVSGDDIVISKFNSDLTSLLASTFIGGNDNEGTPSIAIDGSDNIFIGSGTSSTNYPTLNGFQNTKEDDEDIVISKFTNDLALSASTYLGGDEDENPGGEGSKIVIDTSNNVYVVARSNSTNFVTSGTTGHDQTQNGEFDIVVAKLNNALSSLSAITYLGGSGEEEDPTIAIDSSGNIFVATETQSNDFPITSGVYDTTRNTSGSDESITISKFDNTLSTLSASTFISGTDDEDDPNLAFDSSGNVYVSIGTSSSDFPTAGTPFDSSYNGGDDIVIAKLDNSLTTLLATTFLGGSLREGDANIQIDNADNIFVAANTYSTNVALAGSSFDTSFSDTNSGRDIFISKLDSSLSSLLASTYLGGTDDEDLSTFNTFVLDDSGNVHLTVETASSDYPTTSGVAFPTFLDTNSDDDLGITIINCNLSKGAKCETISDSSKTITIGEDDKSGIFQYSGNILNVTAPSGTAAATTLQIRVNQNNDDAEEENSTNVVSVDSTDLELVDDSGIHTVGMRFNSVNIPKDSVIGDAFIQFTVDGTDSETTNLTIKGEDKDNASIFAAVNENVTSRTTTDASVSWSPSAWNIIGIAGDDQKTSNLKTIVQEIVNRDNWSSGNSMAFIFTGSGKRDAESHDGNSSLAPLLTLTYGSTITASTVSTSNVELNTNLATAVDISASVCSGTCTVEFTIPNSVLSAKGLSSSASMYHDSNGNGLIEVSEAIDTTTDTTTISDSTIFSATTTSTSIFAVGATAILFTDSSDSSQDIAQAAASKPDESFALPEEEYDEVVSKSLASPIIETVEVPVVETFEEVKAPEKVESTPEDTSFKRLSKSDDKEDDAKKMGLEFKDGDVRALIILDKTSDAVINEIKKFAYIESVNKDLVQIHIPLEDLNTLYKIPDITKVQPTSKAIQNVLTSQGYDYIQAQIPHGLGVQADGIKIAVLDLAFDVTNDEIKNNVVESKTFRHDFDGLKIPLTGFGHESLHGTAVSEIVIDVAPKAELYLYTFASEVEFLDAMDYAMEQKVDLITMSAGWVNYPTDGTSEMTKKVEEAINQGIPFVVSAGNYAETHWEGKYVDFNNNGWHEFAPSDEGISVVASEDRVEQQIPFVLYLMWDSPSGTVYDFDLSMTDEEGDVISYSANLQESNNAINFEYVYFTPEEPGTYSLGILYGGIESPDVTLELFSPSDKLEYPVSVGSVSVPTDAKGVISVGALNYYDSRLEPFSSQGPTNHCVQAPSIMGPDAVATLAYNKAPFFGTSAAAPHVAGIVALMLDKTPQLTPLEILSELTANTITEFSSYEELNNVFGFGAADSEFISVLDEIVDPIVLDDGCMLSKLQTSERYGDSDQQSKFAVAGIVNQQIIVLEKIPIPEWVKLNAGWWSDGSMNDDTFTNAIGFLIEKQIIDIPMKENVSEAPKDKEKYDFELDEIIPIPDWIKNNAGWWSDGTINDDAFVSAIQYLVEQGIIDV